MDFVAPSLDIPSGNICADAIIVPIFACSNMKLFTLTNIPKIPKITLQGAIDQINYEYDDNKPVKLTVVFVVNSSKSVVL